MTRLLVLAALWCPLVVVACCPPPSVVRVPVVVEPPPCRERDAPLDPPPGAKYGDAAWSRWFAMELVPWIAEVERACPKREHRTDAEETAGAYGETVR